MHGAKVGKTGDIDLYGVYIEDPEHALDLDPSEHFAGWLRKSISIPGNKLQYKLKLVSIDIIAGTG